MAAKKKANLDPVFFRVRVAEAGAGFEAGDFFYLERSNGQPEFFERDGVKFFIDWQANSDFDGSAFRA